MKPALNLAGYADASPDWRWIVPFWDDVDVDWSYFSTMKGKWESALPGPHWGRIRAAIQLNLISRRVNPDLLVSVGPANSFYVEAIGERGRRRIPHLAWAFNFTGLPQGRQHTAMRRHLTRIERFVVFSRMERELYAAHFDLPVERFHFVHWGVKPPIAHPGPRVIATPYIVALGGEARDYVTLCAAARRLPGVRFVLIVRGHSLHGVDVPGNVDVHVNLPWEDAWSLVAHAEAAIVPLLTGDTPNGHVTLVGGMQLGKAQIVTASSGIRDYASDGETALLIPPGDPVAMAHAIERLIDDAPLRTRLEQQARAFADTHCSEQVTVDFARQQVRALTGI